MDLAVLIAITEESRPTTRSGLSYNPCNQSFHDTHTSLLMGPDQTRCRKTGPHAAGSVHGLCPASTPQSTGASVETVGAETRAREQSVPDRALVATSSIGDRDLGHGQGENLGT